MSVIAEPEGISSFSDNHSSFNNEQVVPVSEPTAAVQSASNNLIKKVSIIENPTFLNSNTETSDEVENEDKNSNMMDTLQNVFEENQTVILLTVGVLVGYYFYKNKK